MSDPRFQAEFVELIVREVIRRLRESGTTVVTAGNAKPDNAVADASVGLAELAVVDRVVTLSTLRDRLNGVKRVTVARKAIVTPAVKDELNRKKIELVRK